MKPFAVLVLNWNGEALLKQFLPFWTKYTETDLSDLIIVDNGSTDGSLVLLESYEPKLRLIKFVENKGYADGYNEAIKLLEHEYVVLLNSDATPKSLDWLKQPLKLFENNSNLVALQPKIKAFNNPKFFEYAGAAGGYLDCLAYPYCDGRVLDRTEEDRGQYEETKNILWASGAALFVRRQDFLDSGGLDGRFFAHQEEIDLCFRLRSRGFDIVYAPKSEVFHVGGASLDNESPRKLYLNFRNNLLMLYKNLNLNYLLWLYPCRFFLDFLAGFVFLLRGEGGKCKAVFRAYFDFMKMRPIFRRDRKTNLSLQKVKASSLLSSHSILFNRYIKGE